MQIRTVRKKSQFFLYLSVFMLAFTLAYYYKYYSQDVNITFSAKAENSGWVVEKSSESDPSSAFASESSLLNALKIKLDGSLSGGIQYTFHATDGAWLDWSKDGEVINSDNTQSFNAIKVKLYGDVSKQFNILYRIKTQNDGWTEWKKNGAIAGDASSTNPIIGLQVKVEDTSPIATIKKLVDKSTNKTKPKEVEPENTVNTDNTLTPISQETVSTTEIAELKQLDEPIKGIDVSYYNGTINWTKVKNAGIDYAIIQVGYRGCTQGSLKEDPKYLTNIKGAIAAGVKVGIYFVTQAITVEEAIEEAEYVLDNVGNFSIDYPIYIDIEDVNNSRQANLTTKERTAICKAFCDTIYEAGYETGIYSCLNYFQNKLTVSALSNYNLWVANYEISQRPTTNFPYQMWQCSETGKVDGISTNVDINYVYYDYPNYVRSYTTESSTTSMIE